MPRNVEIKASVLDVCRLKNLASELSGQSEPVIIHQEDTFFCINSGRLKLRKLQDVPSQLIYYKRSDSEGPKESFYTLSETSDPDGLTETLSHALGIRAMVKKTRYLYMIGQTRVHVDDVAGLGDFMELEVVLDDDQTSEDGQKIANDLMKKLEIKEGQLIAGAYVDMLIARKEENKTP